MFRGIVLSDPPKQTSKRDWGKVQVAYLESMDSRLSLPIDYKWHVKNSQLSLPSWVQIKIPTKLIYLRKQKRLGIASFRQKCH